jgi:hypothetical protein
MPPVPTPPPSPAKQRLNRRYVILAGILLALVCKALPPAYQAPCATIVNLCTGGL